MILAALALGTRESASQQTAEALEHDNAQHSIRVQLAELTNEVEYQRKETQAKQVQLRQANCEIDRLRSELDAQAAQNADLATAVEQERRSAMALRAELVGAKESLHSTVESGSHRSIFSRIFN